MICTVGYAIWWELTPSYFAVMNAYLKSNLASADEFPSAEVRCPEIISHGHY